MSLEQKHSKDGNSAICQYCNECHGEYESYYDEHLCIGCLMEIEDQEMDLLFSELSESTEGIQ